MCSPSCLRGYEESFLVPPQPVLNPIVISNRNFYSYPHYRGFPGSVPSARLPGGNLGQESVCEDAGGAPAGVGRPAGRSHTLDVVQRPMREGDCWCRRRLGPMDFGFRFGSGLVPSHPRAHAWEEVTHGHQRPRRTLSDVSLRPRLLCRPGRRDRTRSRRLPAELGARPRSKAPARTVRHELALKAYSLHCHPPTRFYSCPTLRGLPGSVLSQSASRGEARTSSLPVTMREVSQLVSDVLQADFHRVGVAEQRVSEGDCCAVAGSAPVDFGFRWEAAWRPLTPTLLSGG